MKKLLLTLLTPTLLLSQYPLTEEFNPSTNWTFTNGAGTQTYNSVDYYGTFNTGFNRYPNNSTITITSPTVPASLTCGMDLDIQFALEGEIENGYDFMFFEYYNGATWVTVDTYTGGQNNVFNYTVPPTAERYRFRLETDASVNSYFVFNPFTMSFDNYIYYYDIDFITVNCISMLPVELLSFSGDCNGLKWKTASEKDCQNYTIEYSQDGKQWNVLKDNINCYNSTSGGEYFTTNLNIKSGYYRLIQTDYDGKQTTFEEIAISCTNQPKNVVNIYNSMGQNVGRSLPNNSGIYLIEYEDGTTTKTIVK